MEGVGGKGGASVSLNRCGGGGEEEEEGQKRDKSHLINSRREVYPDPSPQIWEKSKTSLINMSKGQACSVKGRNLNPQESGDMCSIFGFNHKSNSAGYFKKGG